MVRDAADDAHKDFWDETNFIEILSSSMASRSTIASARPTAWKTRPTRFTRHDQFRPLIVGNLKSCHDLPTNNKRKRISESRTVFDFVERTSGGRNTFFRWIHRTEGGGPQLNNILLGRIVTGIESKFKGKNKNAPAWQERCHDITLKQKLNLGHFWSDTRAFEQAVREFRKAKQSALALATHCANQNNWRCRGDGQGHGGIELFMHPIVVEQTMDRHLELKRWEKALVHSQNGFLTENFLSFLIQLKIEHGRFLEKNNNKTCALHLFLDDFELW